MKKLILSIALFSFFILSSIQGLAQSSSTPKEYGISIQEELVFSFLNNSKDCVLIKNNSVELECWVTVKEYTIMSNGFWGNPRVVKEIKYVSTNPGPGWAPKGEKVYTSPFILDLDYYYGDLDHYEYEDPIILDSGGVWGGNVMGDKQVIVEYKLYEKGKEPIGEYEWAVYNTFSLEDNLMEVSWGNTKCIEGPYFSRVDPYILK